MAIKKVAECDSCGQQVDVDENGFPPAGWISTLTVTEETKKEVTFFGDEEEVPATHSLIFCGKRCLNSWAMVTVP